MCNTLNRDGIGRINLACNHSFYTYSQLRQLGFSVWVVDEKGLKENLLGIDTLFVGQKDWLSDSEKQVIDEFIKNGGKVYCISNYSGKGYGLLEYNEEKGIYNQHYRVEDAIYACGKSPLVKSDNSSLICQLLEGSNYHLVSVVNIAYPPRSISGKLTCAFDVTEAVAYSVEKGKQKLEVSNNTISIAELIEGCIILVK